MPKRGDLLYQVSWKNGGEIEYVTFLEESLAEGASIPTWIVRGVGKSWDDIPPRTRVSVDYYYTTPEAAWLAYQEEVRESIPACQQAVDKAKQELVECQQRLRRVEAVLLRNDWKGKSSQKSS